MRVNINSEKLDIMKTTKLFLAFVLIGIFQVAYGQWDVTVTGQLLNTNSAPIVVNLNFYDGGSGSSASPVTDVNGYYTHTFTGNATSSGTVELIVHDCNGDTIQETKTYSVPNNDTLVNFTTADYCPIDSANVYVSGNLTNTNSAAITVYLTLYSNPGNPTTTTVVTNPNGDYSHTFTTSPTSQGTVHMQADDCHSDSIFEIQSYNLNINDSIVNFTTADYCPVNIIQSNIQVYGQLTNTNAAPINVLLTYIDSSGSVTTETVVTDANGVYAHAFIPFSDTGSVHMSFNNCNSDFISESQTYDLTIGDSSAVFTTHNYCPATTCQAYFTVAQATAPNGGPLAGSVQVTDGSTASHPANLTYIWHFGDGSPNGSGTVLTHNYSLNGPYALCLTILDGLGCISSFCDTISVDDSGMLESMGFTLLIGHEILGIGDTDFSSNVNIYPNPASDFINIELNTEDIVLSRITMYDLTGKVVFENKTNSELANKITINTENIKTGTYIIQMVNEKEIYNQKVIIK